MTRDVEFRGSKRYHKFHRKLGGNPNAHLNESGLIIPKPPKPKLVEPPERRFEWGSFRCKYCKFEVEGANAEHALIEHLKNHGVNN